MAAEFITAVIHPSYWQPPYIYILPEFFLGKIVESLFYFGDVTPCNMKWIEKSILFDVAVIDSYNSLSAPDYFDEGYVSFNRHFFGLYQ